MLAASMPPRVSSPELLDAACCAARIPICEVARDQIEAAARNTPGVSSPELLDAARRAAQISICEAARDQIDAARDSLDLDLLRRPARR